MSGAVVCCFSDPADYRISVDGKVFRFDFGERFGPWVVGKNGKEVAQPGSRHKFWQAVTQWHKQGKRVGEDGLCIWEPEPPLFTEEELSRDYVKIGRQYFPKAMYAKTYAKLQAKGKDLSGLPKP